MLPEVAGAEAFPGAEGFGRRSRGGRGGKIIAVTTLNDRGPGSLRECIGAKGPRICVFRVSGVIRFTSQRPIIRNPFITIAGQTAPGGGIIVTHGGGKDGLTPIVVKNTHDVIIRHIRVRTDRNAAHRGSNGSFTFENSRNVIFDHVSGAWAQGQIVAGSKFNNNITIANSIFTQAIPKREKCALLASHPTKPQKISFIRNICAQNGGGSPHVNFMPGSCIEIINNVLYNARSRFTEIHEYFGGSALNVVSNYYKGGPDSRNYIAAVDRVAYDNPRNSELFLAGNVLDGVQKLVTKDANVAVVERPACPLSVRVMSAEEAYAQALMSAGAFPRDSLDDLTALEVRQRSGRILQDRAMLGGPRPLPAIAPGMPYVDLDEDGMADSWERIHGMDPRKNDAWQDADHDKWLNLDEFLDFAHRQVMAGRHIR